MEQIIDLSAFPIDQPASAQCRRLVEQCKSDLARDGMFNLDGFFRPEAASRSVEQLMPTMTASAFTHSRIHNIYFKSEIDGLEADHPALQTFETVNHTLCADQLADTDLRNLYRFEPLIRFLEAVMEKPQLHTMADPLAAMNVMAYYEGEALNWHFDRSEFTTTLLLQEPVSGGVFEYRTDLRSDDEPNYNGVARLLQDEDPEKKQLALKAGTLNVFKGKNTAHRVTPVKGEKPRLIAVFSYYEREGVKFSDEERLGFYGRTH